MTIRQASKRLGRTVRTIRYWISIGKIKAYKNGNLWDIPEEEVQKHENKN